MWPPYGPGQPDWQGFDPEQVMGGPVAYDQYPNLMRGMNQDFIERADGYYRENFDPYGMGWSYGPAAPAAPGMLGVNTMPPPPLLMGGPGLGNSPKGSGGGFGWQDAFNIGLPLAAGAAGFMAGIAPQGNPQTVLQGLSLAQRAQMMPRPEQAAAMQRQKFIQELIASGQATPEGLAQLKAQYPGMATEIDAVMPAAQDRSDMSRFIRSKVPGFGQTGAPPPPPGAGSSQSGSLGGGLPPPPSTSPQYDYLPSMSIGGDGKSSMSLSPHARPQPQLNDVEQSLSKIQTLNQEIQRLSQSPNQSDQNVVQQMVTARNALIVGLRGKPQSTAGQSTYDEMIFPDAQPYQRQALRGQTVNAGRVTQTTPAGQAQEDVYQARAAHDLTNEDPQLADLQQIADIRGLAGDNKAVSEAIAGTNAIDQTKQQYGSESDQARNAQTAFNRDTLKQTAPSVSDTTSMRGQALSLSQQYAEARNHYRQIESVMHNAATTDPQLERTVIISLAHVLEPTSAVMKGEFDAIRDATDIPSDIKRRLLENFSSLGQGRILTDKQLYDMVEQSRKVYLSRLSTHSQNMSEMSGIATRSGIDPQNVTVYQPDAIDRAYLNKTPAPRAIVDAAIAQAIKLAPGQDDDAASRRQSIANEIILRQGYNPYSNFAP